MTIGDTFITDDGSTNTYLGDVAVDSGRLTIVDPCNADTVKQNAEFTGLYGYLTETYAKEATVVVGIDGLYPVYLRRNPDGSPAEISIVLDQN